MAVSPFIMVFDLTAGDRDVAVMTFALEVAPFIMVFRVTAGIFRTAAIVAEMLEITSDIAARMAAHATPVATSMFEMIVAMNVLLIQSVTAKAAVVVVMVFVRTVKIQRPFHSTRARALLRGHGRVVVHILRFESMVNRLIVGLDHFVQGFNELVNAVRAVPVEFVFNTGEVLDPRIEVKQPNIELGRRPVYGGANSHQGQGNNREVSPFRLNSLSLHRSEE